MYIDLLHQCSQMFVYMCVPMFIIARLDGFVFITWRFLQNKKLNLIRWFKFISKFCNNKVNECISSFIAVRHDHEDVFVRFWSKTVSTPCLWLVKCKIIANVALDKRVVRYFNSERRKSGMKDFVCRLIIEAISWHWKLALITRQNCKWTFKNDIFNLCLFQLWTYGCGYHDNFNLII